MLVICLEGCHGSGKSELLSEFSRRGYHVLDEGFLDMPEYSIHPQSLLMETTWTCSWFERLLRLKKSGDNAPVAFADRSPFSAVYYGAHGHLLEPVIREHINEVLEQADIRIVTVHVSVEEKLLWERIQERLLREPTRARLQEGKKTWMQTTLEWYNSFSWDLSVSNGRQAISRTADSVVQAVKDAHDLSDDIFDEAKSYFLSSPVTPVTMAGSAANSHEKVGASDPRSRSQTSNEPELMSLSGATHSLELPSRLQRAASASHLSHSAASAAGTPVLTYGCSSPPSEAASSCGTPTLRRQRMAPSPQSRDSPLTCPESSLDTAVQGSARSLASRPAARVHASASARLRCGSAPGEDEIWNDAALGNTAQMLSFD